MKKKYRVENWHEYNEALKNRGSLTIWMEEGFEKAWLSSSAHIRNKGRPLKYSNHCIQLMLTVRHLFKLPLRQTEGFVKSIFNLLDLSLDVPEFSRLSRRMGGSLSAIKYPKIEDNTYLVIDSSGLKVFGEQEWLETKHGKCYTRKVWRKLHIGIDQAGNIVASELSSHKTDDRKCFSKIVNSLEINCISEALADSGYDSHNIYKECAKNKIKVLIPPPKNAVIDASKGDTYSRNQTIAYIEQKGIHAWYNKNNFGRRNKVENTFFRLKTIFGRKLHSRTWGNQESESKLICHLLNQMTSLGMPISTLKAA